MPTQSGSQGLAGELPAIHGTSICPTHYNVSCEHWSRRRAPYSHLQSPAFSWVLLSLLLIQVSTCFSFSWDFPGGSEVKASACNAGDLRSIPGLGRFPWRRKWQPTPVLLPRNSHGWRILVVYSPWGRKESDTTDGCPVKTWVCIFFLPQNDRMVKSKTVYWLTYSFTLSRQS